MADCKDMDQDDNNVAFIYIFVKNSFSCYQMLYESQSNTNCGEIFFVGLWQFIYWYTI